jgi:hypothetical protein
MSEFQMTHPEKAQPQAISRSKALLSALRFAFAALVVGSRAVPMGDNAHLVGELCAHAARLRTDA